MNKTKVKTSISEGWAIHFYDSDRHLRFTLEPSHLWVFSWGIGVGLIVAIMWSVLSSSFHSLSSNTKNLQNLSPTPETTSKEGDRTESHNSLLFRID